MLRCEYCSHECTVVDFVTLRNLCEHLYLDSIAQKSQGFWPSNTVSIYGGKAFQPLSHRGPVPIPEVAFEELSLHK